MTDPQTIAIEEDPKEQGAKPKAQLQKEYVAGGLFSWPKLIRALPFYFDDLTRDFGDDIYERMLNDPQVDSCVEILKLAILAQGVHLLPSRKQLDPDYKESVKYRDFCKRNLECHLDQDFITGPLYDMLDALPLGNKIAEKVYYIPDKGEDKGLVCLRRLKVKPRRTVAFAVDPYLNVIGILGRLPGRGGPALISSIAVEAVKAEWFLPREKFAVLTYRPKNGDPRGTSCIRPAYNPWWLKTQVWPEYLKFLVQFASPSLIGTLSANAQRLPKVDPNTGQFELDNQGNVVYVDPETAMLSMLLAFQNGTALVIPNDAKVNALEVRNQGDPFDAAIALFDRQIAKSILNQTLATEEAKFQARAAAQTHQDILGLPIRYGKKAVEAMIKRDICYYLLKYNYGKEIADKYTPEVNLSETEAQDFPEFATAIAKLKHTGFLHHSQFEEIDSWLNLPQRRPGWEEEYMEMQKAQAGLTNNPDDVDNDVDSNQRDNANSKPRKSGTEGEDAPSDPEAGDVATP
jgi:hypothetical protein